MTTDFFSRFLLSRNHKIQIVAHVEGKSVALLSGIMEASYRLFFIGQGFNCSRSSFRCLSKGFKNYHSEASQLPLQDSQGGVLVWPHGSPYRIRRPIFTDFYRFFGLSWEDTASMLLFDMHADLFGRFVLQRNRYIRSAELFEESSILLLLRRLEASE